MAGDLNGDGLLDLVVTLPESGRVAPFLQQANGPYAAAPLVNIGGESAQQALLDLNGDGRADLVSTPLTEAGPRLVVMLAGPGGVLAPAQEQLQKLAASVEALDAAGHEEVGILAYSAKYASAFYGPFREAVDSSLVGDRRTYQQDPANAREGVREALLDVAEGADVVMVKPALAYLDVIHRVRAAVEVPVAAYNVSGEYAAVAAAAERGWLDRDATVMESLLGIRRAGADVILTYWATLAAQLLNHR